MQEIQTNAVMTDRDWATDILILEKHLAVSYSVAANEASNQPLFQFIQSISEETARQQHTLYSLMQQQNWYKPEQETPNKIQTAAQQARTDQSQLPLS
ncbi:spore coat protein [Jeotgalibacillus aurantiacus]|uniref:spore coat protein n=1 Tax=Jeotgalibacillus aurantiacus TaxID=2763266 RepID=UPI001D0A148C|nr:spore coat protein [Jeotgalibacillus aurantiacus]